jgi:molybdate transport system substrate-binding protein
MTFLLAAPPSKRPPPLIVARIERKRNPGTPCQRGDAAPPVSLTLNPGYRTHEVGAGMLKVFCARSMHVAVAALSQRFAEASGAAPEIVFEPMGALQARLAGGETADVLILTAPAIGDLLTSGALLSDIARIGRAPIGIAVREGAPAPDITTPDAFKDALMAARGIALSDPAVGGSAGIYLRELFERLGLAEIVAAKTVAQKSGVAAADAVGRGEADLAMTFIPELLQGKGVRIVGPLPHPYGHSIAYTAAVSVRSSFPDEASAFIAVLTAPETASVWTAAGFKLPPDFGGGGRRA